MTGSGGPVPPPRPPAAIYNFTTWGVQLTDFLEQVVGEPGVLICNSVGGGWQAGRDGFKHA